MSATTIPNGSTLPPSLEQIPIQNTEPEAKPEWSTPLRQSRRQAATSSKRWRSSPDMGTLADLHPYNDRKPMISMPLPSLVSHVDALALQLQPDEPLDVTSGDPRATMLELHRDDVVQCGVWEVTPGQFAGENAGFGEHMHILCGEATVTSDDGATVELRPGVSFVARAGWRGHWHVRETVRKIYVIWKVP